MLRFSSLALLLGAAALAEAGPNEDRAQYTSGGKKITVERFLPGKEGKHPVLLLIHGSDGLSKRGDDYRAASRVISQRGYLVLLVHLFDRCGTVDANKEIINREFFNWVGTIHDGIAWAGKLAEADPTRIGLIGYSLGGYLCLSSQALAAKPEHRAGVIVEYFGGLPKMLAWDFATKRLPPTLILHGEKDRLVPVSEARDLEQTLKTVGVLHEVKIYPDQGHGFDPKTSQEAMELGFKFLEKHFVSRGK